MWRYDAARSAASPEQLPRELRLQWVRRYPPLKSAWKDLRLWFDRYYQPVVMGKTLFLGSSLTDAVVAIDTDTGARKWRFWTDAPVRFAPVAAAGKVYVASDDGYLYCLDAASGKLLWKFRGATTDRKLIGNERLISAWPARGGPVLVDGTVYFAAGIWPFMGVSVHALDARTGKPIWTNRECNSLFRVVDHKYRDYVGISPQGYLVVVGDRLIVPCGRAWPAVFDRKTGKLIHFAQGQELEFTKGTPWVRKSDWEGNWRVVAGARRFFNTVDYNGRAIGGIFDAATGRIVEMMSASKLPDELVIAGHVLYGADKNVRAFHGAQRKIDARTGLQLTQRWVCKTPARVLIKAGSRLYAGAPNVVKVIDVPSDDGPPEVSWRAPVKGDPRSLVAADGKLFVVTAEGGLYCFGPKEGKGREYAPAAKRGAKSADKWTRQAARILESTGATEGYCIVLGIGDGRLVEELARRSKLDIIAVDADEKKIRAARRLLDQSGLYGKRAAAFAAPPLAIDFSPYLASLIVAETAETLGMSSENSAGKIFRLLRPYGGKLCVRTTADEHRGFARWVAGAKLPGAKVARAGDFSVLERAGALAGSADWTHEYYDAARTLCSPDALVRPPLGVLWFGGPTEQIFLRPLIIPRYYPAPQVVGGRLFAQSMKTLYAADVYTGRLLWEIPLPDPKEVFDVYRVRTPGYTSVSLEDGLYVACGELCMRLDPATGKKLAEFRLPGEGPRGEKPYWVQFAAWDDLLIATAAFPNRFWDSGYASLRKHGLTGPEFARLLEWAAALKTAGKIKKRKGESSNALYERTIREILESENFSANFPEDLRRALAKGVALRLNTGDRIVAVNRYSGKVLWTREAAWGFIHLNNQLGNPRVESVAVGGGKVFCVDGMPKRYVQMMRRRGMAPKREPRLLALDARTGELLWSTPDVNGSAWTWVACAKKHDAVVTGGGYALQVFNGSDGVELWSKRVLNNRTSIIHDGRIIIMTMKGDLSGSSLGSAYDTMYRTWTIYDLLTGEEKGRFEAPGAYCGVATGATELILFRATSAAYYDFKTQSVRNLSAFRTGCSINLIPAGGVVSAPAYSNHCWCNYPIFTSLALVHTPELPRWVKLSPQTGRLPLLKKEKTAR